MYGSTMNGIHKVVKIMAKRIPIISYRCTKKIPLDIMRIASQIGINLL